MAVYKCKMCSGDLDISEGVSVVECEFCGTKQTVPTAKDENLQGLFNRANVLRMKSEFDKAEQIYEKIIQANEKEAEAYWGLILCKYGIEYVEDPATFRRVPTCHRTSFDSIIADDNYKCAMEYADGVQRGIYESEAKEIDRIQKDILALSQKEEPYDVFICYKETDNIGQRTQDSVIANDIYYQLTQEGFKVFYAAITLEDKLGSAYEPCIFAALNSAKVMLAIGTKPEYFNAVWVKNEWSRYLKMMKADRSKILIPCYKGMDAYELPEEFAHLQAQDMGKIGFINDIVRGIKKVISKDDNKSAVKETVVINSNANVDPLLERAFMFIEDKNWKDADSYCEKVLDQDPKNARAYVAKLMIEQKVCRQEDLVNCAEPFDNSNSYQKAVKFADDGLRGVLTGYVASIKERNETNRLDEIYNRAKATKDSAKDEATFKKAASIFETIPDWRDAREQAEDCKNLAENARKDRIYDDGISKMHSVNEGELLKAASLFESIRDWKNSEALAVECRTKAEIAHKDWIYDRALDLMAVQHNYQEALKNFESIKGWKSSDKHVEACKKNIENAPKVAIINEAKELARNDTVSSLQLAINKLEQLQGWGESTDLIENYEARIEELNRKEEERKANEAKRIANEAKRAKKKRITIILIIIVTLIVLAIASALFLIVIPKSYYSKAVAYETANDLDNAIKYYKKAGIYEDSQDKLRETSVANVKNYSVGDKVWLGKYNGKVLKWTVTSVEEDHIVLVCDSIVTNKAFNDGGGGYSEPEIHYNEWPKCTLRTWLNSTFYDEAFNENEKNALSKATVISDGCDKDDGTSEDYVYIIGLHDLSDVVNSGWDENSAIRKKVIWLRGSDGTNGLYGNTAFYLGDHERISNSYGIVPVIWLNRR